MKNIKKTFHHLFYLLNIVYNQKNGRKYILFKILLTVISPFVSMIGIFVPGFLIDELTNSVRYDRIVIYIILLTFVPYLWNMVQRTINHYCIDVLRYELNRKLEADFYKHIAKLDYDFFDKPYLADLQSQANEVVMNDMIGSVDSLCKLISTTISLFALSSLIAQLNPMIIAIIVTTLIINFFISKTHKNKVLQYEDEAKKRRRHKWIYTYLFSSNLYAKEMRLFQMGDFLSSKVVETNQKIDELNHQLNKHSFNANCGHLSTSLFQNILVFIIKPRE